MKQQLFILKLKFKLRYDIYLKLKCAIYQMEFVKLKLNLLSSNLSCDNFI